MTNQTPEQENPLTREEFIEIINKKPDESPKSPYGLTPINQPEQLKKEETCDCWRTGGTCSKCPEQLNTEEEV